MKIDYSTKTTAQLLSNLNMIKVLIVALLIILSLLIGISIYGMLTKDDNATFIATLAVGLCCSATLPVQFMSKKAIKVELIKREETL